MFLCPQGDTLYTDNTKTKECEHLKNGWMPAGLLFCQAFCHEAICYEMSLKSKSAIFEQN